MIDAKRSSGTGSRPIKLHQAEEGNTKTQNSVTHYTQVVSQNTIEHDKICIRAHNHLSLSHTLMLINPCFPKTKKKVI